MRRSRVALAFALVAISPFLHGCTAGMALQAVPLAIGSVAMAKAGDEDLFADRSQFAHQRSGAELARLDRQIRLAECGDAASQYWIASTLQNNLRATPNNVEIYKWYRLAEIGEFEPATEQIAALDATMTAPELERAGALASEWRPSADGCP